MKIGDRIQVKAYKADGTCYRWWQATVEAVEEGVVVVVNPAGHRVQGIDGDWESRHAIRGYYWPDRWYSLLEAYTPNGTLEEIYVNISSPAEIHDGEIRFTDYELDVSRRPPQEACVFDEDEFAAAASEYGYSEEFQRACYRVVAEALEVADGWLAQGMPAGDGGG
jgi:protein associated with RNAse G/E